MDVDNVLNELGNFGKFQIVNYILVGIPILLSAAYTLSYVFTAGNLDYRCRIPKCDGQNATFSPDWLQNAIPLQESHPSRCLRFAPWNITSTHLDGNSVCPSTLFDQNITIKCHDWVFNGEEITIVNEWSLTCEENEWKLLLVGTVNNIGQFIGYPLIGFMSDRLGRRNGLVISTVGAGVMGVARSFAWSYESFLVFEFLDPVFASGIYTSAFTLGMELVGPGARVLGATIMPIFYTIGGALLGTAAMWLLNWRHLLLVLYIPALFCISYIWLIPESVRWLLAMGKTKEARSIFLQASKTNRKNLTDQMLDKFEMAPMVEGQLKDMECDVNSTKDIFKEFLHSKILLLRVLNCSFCWITITFVFFGLSLTSVSVGGDKFSNFILVALIEIPSLIVYYYMMNTSGRKTTLCSSLVLSGVCCLSFVIVPTDMYVMRLGLFLAGKFAISISFNVVYVYTSEIFPTELRQSLLGVCAMFGRIGSIVAPQTPQLDKYLESLPLLLFGGMSILSGLLSLSFPDTRNSKLPDTVEEAENIGKKDLMKKRRWHCKIKLPDKMPS